MDKELEYIHKYKIKYFYHMTAIDNLYSILKNGLLSHNQAHQDKLLNIDISDPEVQDIRADKIDPIFNRPLHDYVPLYFSPRNPMLYKRGEIQENVVILGISSSVLLYTNTIFSDGNASAQDTTFYQGATMLDNLNWDVINANSWSEFPDGRRIKCAEILVYPKVEVKDILIVFFYWGSQVNKIIPIIKSLAKPINISNQYKVNLNCFFKIFL